VIYRGKQREIVREILGPELADAAELRDDRGPYIDPGQFKFRVLLFKRALAREREESAARPEE